MTTIEKKVSGYLTKYVGAFTNRQERALITLLRIQDRDTRHACAEAVLQCKGSLKTAAHRACINAHAL